MDDRFPESVDVVVIGTGLPESIIAAACARSGLDVLNLDRNDYYGGDWASFNLSTLQKWLDKKAKRTGNGGELDEENVRSTYKEMFSEGEELVVLPQNDQLIDVEGGWTEESNEVLTSPAAPSAATTAEATPEGSDATTTATIRESLERKGWQRFSVDLAPKVLLSRGPMVKTLCDSEVAKYAEFKCVDRLLCAEPSSPSPLLNPVPFSRSEIFESDDISFIDKRKLMKFMQYCAQWHANAEELEDWKEYAYRPFDEFLQSQQLSERSKNYIINAIAILHPKPSTKEGLSAVCRFVDSVGQFGPSPFLASLYGSGELPQCFSRLCAVFSGVYCLGRPVEAIVTKGNKVCAVIASGQRVNCSHVIMSPSVVPKEYGTQADKFLERRTFITKGSLVPNTKEHISLVSLSALSQLPITLIEAGWECSMAAKGYFVAHAQSETDDAQAMDEVLQSVYERSVEEGQEPAKVLYRLKFRVRSAPFVTSEAAPTNLAVTLPSDPSLDYAHIIEESQRLFAGFWPDRDFLPRSLKKSEEEEETKEDEDTVESTPSEEIQTIEAEKREDL